MSPKKFYKFSVTYTQVHHKRHFAMALKSMALSNKWVDFIWKKRQSCYDISICYIFIYIPTNKQEKDSWFASVPMWEQSSSRKWCIICSWFTELFWSHNELSSQILMSRFFLTGLNFSLHNGHFVSKFTSWHVLAIWSTEPTNFSIYNKN